MRKAIIFDFDYTLGDSTNGIALSINYALEKLGYALPPIEDIKKTIGLSLTETYFALIFSHFTMNPQILNIQVLNILCISFK